MIITTIKNQTENTQLFKNWKPILLVRERVDEVGE